MFLVGHIVIVTYCGTNVTTTYSAMIGQFLDTMSLATTNIKWLYDP